MKNSVKATLIAVAAAIVLIIGGIAFALNQQASVPESTTRADSHVLDDGGADAVTVVEFLDFECEACVAFYPIVEELRTQYDGDITYVVRHLPNHVNSTQAALAAEAAADQGRFEDMYKLLFETQEQWGHQQTETPEAFRALAEELGLDLDQYDASIADPATLERVQQDADDAKALGASKTPSFFIDGEPVELQEWDDLEEAIEKAVNG